ncbi:MAG: NERD domain-containing protein [Bacteroidales bacterium]|nr:NERD domain-containing protein [Bacteroidales bacterium]
MEDGLLTTILAAAIFAVIMYFFRLLMNRMKGKVGEKVVARMLGRLPGDKYIVLDDVTVPTPRGSNQIDHLII